ncbi:hypothetical protein P3W24_12250, partial [Luteibacter sp. PPL201]
MLKLPMHDGKRHRPSPVDVQHPAVALDAGTRVVEFPGEKPGQGRPPASQPSPHVDVIRFLPGGISDLFVECSQAAETLVEHPGR